MRKKLLLITSCFIIVMSGCSKKVSIVKYDEQVNINKELTEEITELKTENNELQEKYDNLLDTASNNAISTLYDAYLSAWAETSFENVIYGTVGEQYFQCVVSTTYSGEDLIKNINEKYLQAMKMLSVIPVSSKDGYTFSVKFLDKDDNETIEYVAYCNGEDVNMKSINIDATRSATLINDYLSLN